jgi:hypothetical protein
VFAGLQGSNGHGRQGIVGRRDDDNVSPGPDAGLLGFRGL